MLTIFSYITGIHLLVSKNTIKASGYLVSAQDSVFKYLVLALLPHYLAWRYLSDVIVTLYILWSLGSNALPEKSQVSFWRLKSSSEHRTPSTSYITWLYHLCVMWLQDGMHSGICMKSQHERQITLTLNLSQKHWGWWADLASSHLSSGISGNSRQQGSQVKLTIKYIISAFWAEIQTPVGSQVQHYVALVIPSSLTQ